MADIELHRGFRLYGTNIAEFIDAIESMESATHSRVVSSDKISLAAVVDAESDAFDIAITSNSKESLHDCAQMIWGDIQKRADNGLLTMYCCEADGKFALKALNVEKLLMRPGFTEELVEELRSGSKMTIAIDGKSHIVSDLAFSTLNRRAMLGGDAMSKPCVGRVVECSKAFFLRKPQKLQMIIRTNQNASTIIAAHSERYCYVPQTVLCEIYEKIASEYGRTNCLFWEVTHEISHCYVGFPEIAEDFAKTYNLPVKVIPGLYFSTSDSGDGSLTIRGIWDINGNIAGCETVKRNHRGEIDVSEFVTSAKNTIFSEFQAVPARLAHLLTIDVPDPQFTIRSVFKQIDMYKASNFGRQNTSDLYQELCKELDPAAKYTAYDIAMMIVTLPNRVVGAHYSVVEKMQNLAKKAVFADYTKKDPKKSNASSGITLV